MAVKANSKEATLDADALRRMFKDPILFVKVAFGVNPTHQQEKLLKACSKPHAKITVASGRGTGKTTCLAWIIHWFLLFHDDCNVLCTAPNAAQLKNCLWSELTKWHAKLRHTDFKDSLIIDSRSMYVKGFQKTRVALAITTSKDNPEGMAGLHATNMMVIVDEASGVDEEVFVTIKGTLTTNNPRIVLVSNPRRSTGYFYKTHRDPKISKFWTKLTFSCLESTNVNPEYCASMLEEYTDKKNAYLVEVLGEFPEYDDDGIISRIKIKQAVGREVQYNSSKKIAGLDVGRSGDPSAIVIRQGAKIIHIEKWNKEIDETIGKCISMYEEKLFDHIYVDSIGMGAGVADVLRNYVPTTGVNVSETSSQKIKFVRLRDELWFNAKEFFDDASSCIDDKLELIEELVDELCSPTYKIDINGKIKVESKDLMKARGINSPNIADAFNLTLYNYEVPSKNRHAHSMLYNEYDSYSYSNKNVIL